MPATLSREDAWILSALGIDVRQRPGAGASPDLAATADDKSAAAVAASIEKRVNEASAASSAEIASLGKGFGEVVAVPQKLVAAIDKQVGLLFEDIRKTLLTAASANGGAQLKKTTQELRARLAQDAHLAALRDAAPVFGAKLGIDAKIEGLLEACAGEAAAAA